MNGCLQKNHDDRSILTMLRLLKLKKNWLNVCMYKCMKYIHSHKKKQTLWI